jgi:hypothetical protein
MQGAEVVEGWGVDQLGSENHRFSSRGSVFLSGVTIFNFRLWYEVQSKVVCVRRDFGCLENGSRVPISFRVSATSVQFTKRLINQPSPISLIPRLYTQNRSKTRASISTLTCRSRSWMKKKGPVPRPRPDQRREPSDSENEGCNISSPPPNPNINFSSAESASSYWCTRTAAPQVC